MKFLLMQFGTDFKMMDAEAGRQQTTKGVWLDISSKVTELPTLVMDLEGSDGRERGEDDTTFERQSALFALATSDVLIINMFAVNIGRVHGAGAPLLKTIFQVRRARTTHCSILVQECHARPGGSRSSSPPDSEHVRRRAVRPSMLQAPEASTMCL